MLFKGDMPSSGATFKALSAWRSLVKDGTLGLFKNLFAKFYLRT